MMDGLALMTPIHAAGATIVVLDRKALVLGKGLLSLLSAVFDEERVRIRKRALQGIATAKRRNKRFGRKPKLTAEDATAIRERIRQGNSCTPNRASLPRPPPDHCPHRQGAEPSDMRFVLTQSPRLQKKLNRGYHVRGRGLDNGYSEVGLSARKERCN
jgi:hypothetical protein